MNKLCESCIHNNVCSHMHSFEQYQKEIDNTLEHFFFSDMTKLIYCDFLEPVKLKCKNYLPGIMLGVLHPNESKENINEN